MLGPRQSAGIRRIGAPQAVVGEAIAGDLEAITEQERTHRAVSMDGAEIVAHVHGHGRPLVLVSGSGDGQNDPSSCPNSPSTSRAIR